MNIIIWYISLTNMGSNYILFPILIEIWLIQVKPALPALANLIHSNDEEVLTDACWALSYLSDGTNDKIQGVIETGVCSRLVELLTWVLWTLVSIWKVYAFQCCSAVKF